MRYTSTPAARAASSALSPASEHLEGGAPALLCGSHWATESPWLPVLARKIREAARAADVELRVEVSTIVTEPWTSHRVTQGGLA